MANHPFSDGSTLASKRQNVSAGLLLYRQGEQGLECFLAHPGGPFWRNRHEGAWTIPKGLVEENESHMDAAIREFREETGVEPLGPFAELGSVRLKSGKVIHAWAWEGDADADAIESNLARTEWPRGSGRWITYPEVDRCGWFPALEAKTLINAAQAELIDRLERLLESGAIG